MRKLNLFLIICFSSLFTANLDAATITISSNIKWSAISPSPTSVDGILIGKGMTLTVDVSNAVCAGIQLGIETPPSVRGNGTLVFNNGSQVTVNGNITLGTSSYTGNLIMTNGGNLICQGFIVSNAGSSFTPGTGTVQLTSTGSLPSIGFTKFNNLIINGGNITLNVDITVNGILNLSYGQIILGSKNLTMGPSGSISGFNSSNYLVTNAGGQLKQTVNNDNNYVTFPVGPTAGSYNPLKIKLDNLSITDIFGVRVSGTITNLPYKFNEVIQKEWNISEAVIGGSNATIQFSFGTADFGANFNSNLIPNLYDIGHFTSGAYEVFAGKISGPIGSFYTITDTSAITSFSPFIVGNYNSVTGTLPVELISFSANVISRNVKLSWTTASEQNNSGFEILRSAQNDNLGWSNVGFVTGNGTKSTPTNYFFEDKKLNTGKYNYKLKQIDYNGNYEYHNLSNIIEIGVPNKFSLSQNYPNPFNPATSIDFDIPYDSKVSMKLFDIGGREVMTLLNEHKSAGFYTIQMNGSNLPSGIYFYRISAAANGQKYVMTKKALLIK